MTRNQENRLRERLANRLDLVVDFATLGEYGLESAPVRGGHRERSGTSVRRGRRGCDPAAGWEAFAWPRRGGCDVPSLRDAVARFSPAGARS